MEETEGIVWSTRFEPKDVQHVVEIFRLLNQLDDDETALRWIEVMLDTMDISKQDIREVARQALSAGKEETIVTLAEQLRQEGRRIGEQEGLQKGRQEERAEMLDRLLRKRFGNILDAHVQKRLQSATPDQVARWFDRIFEAGSIEEVLDDKP